MNSLHACFQAQRDAQRLLAHCPWFPWLVPIAFGATVFPLRYVAEHLAGATDLFPPCHPGVLVLLCVVAAMLCVPLYQSAQVVRPLLLFTPVFYALFAHYLIGYSFRLGGHRLGVLLGVPNVLVIGAAAWLIVGSFRVDAKTARRHLWDFSGRLAPLLFVPQVLLLLALSV